MSLPGERKKQVTSALELVGTFLFGTDKARERKANEVLEAVEEKVEEHKARRRPLNDTIDTTGEEVRSREKRR